ncbi:zinc finger protein 501-like [Gymnodraco acuticeps]|uniref:Zinc finger protein 501-like n=1 Tax=Gymnodraco acuticeps TaxID=8218 RepID=A0A6P8TAQ6_GYMAC|nr:zinc finger protein 501-like [Gymnodraco acuticeps]
MRPLYEALKGKAPIQEIDWTADAEVAFKEVKTAQAQVALLAHPSSTAPISITTDASDYAVGAVHEQCVEGAWQPLAFFSRQLTPRERRCPGFPRIFARRGTSSSGTTRTGVPYGPPYNGPFRILEHGDKNLVVDLVGKAECVSVDQVKAAHLDLDQPVGLARPPRRGRPAALMPVTECDSSHSAENKPFSCSVYKKAFSQCRNVKAHMRIHTGEKQFSCSVCEKAFLRREHLKAHMRIHTGEKPHSCSVCKKAFSQNTVLKRHMRIHTGEKPHSCSVCKKAFSQNTDLKRHMEIHTGEKPHSCSVCKKAFSENIDLKRHMSIHTGEKPFSCSVCTKYFALCGHLKKHMRIHTGEKPHSCSVCKKAFSQRGNLKAHMRVHTGEKIYSCNVCDKRFKWCSDLKRHKCVGCQSSQLNEIQTEDNGEAEPPISSSADGGQ